MRRPSSVVRSRSHHLAQKNLDEAGKVPVRTLMVLYPNLVAVHKEAENIDYKYQITGNSPVPWHSGALKYFSEKGVKK